MNYTLKIGNAVLDGGVKNERFWCCWTVEKTLNSQAPLVPTMEAENRITVDFLDFYRCTKETGLSNLFFDRQNGLLNRMPPFSPLLPHHYHEIDAAVRRWMTKNDTSPRSQRYLNWLLWLQWWVGWALQCCQQPAIAVDET